MNILITGGAGFVGSNLAIFLRETFANCTVVCMDNLYRRGSELNLLRLRRHGVIFQWGDIRSSAAFPAGPFDFLIECSAEPSVLAGQDSRLEYMFETNLRGTLNCLEKVRQWHSALLFLSTSRVYPIKGLDDHPWHEGETRFSWTAHGAPTPGITDRGVSENIEMSGARSLYGYTKYASELLIEEYRALWNINAVINRCGVLAGPWQFGRTDQGVLSLWVLAHLLDYPLNYIGFGGSGKQVRDFLHIKDLCELIAEQLRNVELWDGWVGNVSGGIKNSASLLELTELCQEVTGRTIRIGREPATRAGDVRIFIGDCARLFGKTLWRPRLNLSDIVRDTSSWITENQVTLRTL